MNNLIIIFTVLTIVNVVFSTIKSIVTIKGSPLSASLASALYYGYYNIVLIYTVADFPLWQKVLITFICNLVGVFTVKWGESKARKDKLWKVEMTVPAEHTNAIHNDYRLREVPHSYIEGVGKYSIFNFYCATQSQSIAVKSIVKEFDAKYFVVESKEL